MRTNLMKSIVSAFLVVALTCGFAITTSGCGKSNEKSNEDNPPIITSDAFVWSTYGTVKVTQNVKKEHLYYDQLEPEINIEMMKKETEGTQIVITAGEDISYYDLTVSDLKDTKGNVLSKDNIIAYHQKYVLLENNFDDQNKDITLGDYVPDLLLPLTIAKEYKENKIKKGNNQGITVEVTTTHDTIPGVYTGTFVLDLDGKKQNIPVSVTVWDIEYEGKRDFQSNFLIYESNLLAGEYDASPNMVYNYMEMLLDYKVNCSVVTSDEETGYPDGSLADKIEWLGSFIDNDNWNSLDIFGTAMQGDYTSTCESANIIVEYVKEAVKISTPEKPYALYLTWYPAYFEEITEARMPEFYPVWKTGGEWDKTIERIISEINEMPEFQAFTPEFQEQIVDAIKRIASANPCNYYEQWARDCTITFCPILSQFDDDYKVQRYKEVSQEYGNGKLWTYTCIGPYNPFPNFHISDYNLGTRVAGWMFKKYNVNGYLYFMTNAYESGSYASDPVRYVDPYATANREYLCPGDGCLLYPGRYYGSDKPFASNRLVAYRDSMDDYDMLSVYERLLNEKAEKYGLTIDLDDYVMDLYDELFDGVDYKNDDELVLIARRTLANRILALKGDMELIATPIKSGMTIYSAKKTLVINDKTETGVACGSGYKYTITNKGNSTQSVILENVGDTCNFRIYTTKDITLSDVTTNGTTSSGQVLDNVLTAIVNSESKANDGATQRFRPYIQVKVDSLANAKRVNFNLQNTGDEEVEYLLYAVLKDGSTRQIGSTYVHGNSSRQVSIKINEEKITKDILNDVVALRFSFANFKVWDDGSRFFDTRTFTISDMYIECR